MTAAAHHLAFPALRPAGPRQRRNWLMPAAMALMALLPVMLLVIAVMAIMGW